MIKVFILLCER